MTGVLGATCAMAYAAGAMSAGHIFDRFGTYVPALVAGMFLALLSAAAVVLTGFLGRGEKSDVRQPAQVSGGMATVE